VLLAGQARKNLTDAVLKFGQVDSFIGLNRRVGNRENIWNNESGPIDPTFSVLLARSPEGKNLGVMVNYPAHPVILREDNNKMSADFQGVLYRKLGRSLSCPVMYLQACRGDVIPKVFGGVKEMNEFGKKMAEEAQRALAAANPFPNPKVDFASLRVVITFVAPAPLDEFSGELQSLFSRLALHAVMARTVSSLSRGWWRSSAKPGYGGASSLDWRLVDCVPSR
jgi:hypothetical protein